MERLYITQSNDQTYAEYVYKKELRKSGKSEEETAAELEKYKQRQKDQSGGNEGNLVRDHSNYAGNYTQEIHGDYCTLVDQNQVQTINGDYHLDITGDCHITVGGAFVMNAQGSPKIVDDNGNEKIQTFKNMVLLLDLILMECYWC